MDANNEMLGDNLTLIEILKGWACAERLPADHVDMAMSDMQELLTKTQAYEVCKEVEIEFALHDDGTPNFGISFGDAGVCLRAEANNHFDLSLVPTALNAFFNEAIPNSKNYEASIKAFEGRAICTMHLK